ncbi:MAG: SAM-dependent methyltransferase [Acidobacteria bacterium]|nr:MAG: SAM-dependent methyltransferase [Acidobacteriota bacterium]
MEPLIRDISDTARWVAVYRARETERPDAAFRDPFARRLAGERGEQIARAMPMAEEAAWSFIARTHLFDRFIVRAVEGGADLVVNLAAGLDARPYRMTLPPSLRWVEVDLPEILDYKEEVLAAEKPVCALERVRLDLSNVDARRGLFARLGGSARHALVISEGLLIYLMRSDIYDLGRDLAEPAGFRHWVVDIVSPGLLEMLKHRMGDLVRQAGAPYVFGPPEGPPFFERCGWKPIEVRSMLKTAAKLGRLPMLLRMLALLPESAGAQGSRPWAAVCLLSRS